jgi:hypothetical protein
MLTMTRYSIKTKCFAPWLKFLWYFKVLDTNICYKLLPTDNIDVLLNSSESITYETDSTCISATPSYINGLKSRYSYIHQTGNIRMFGIFFTTLGCILLYTSP